MKTTEKYVNRHNSATYIQLFIHLISLSKHYVPATGGPATLWAPAIEDATFSGTFIIRPD